MKTTRTLVTICLMGAFSICNGQTLETISGKKEIVKKDTTKQMNLLDEQTKMFSQIFDMAGASEGNPLAGATNYLEAIEQIDMTEEQKETIREQYKVYDLSLDPTKKDSLKIMVGKMLKNAIEKTQTEIE